MTTLITETMDLPDRVLEIARRDPHRVALVHARRPVLGRMRRHTTTYAELSHRAEATAVGLRGIGVQEGTLCSFMVPPGEDALVLALALWRVGAVMVGIEPHSHGLAKVTRCLSRVGPEVFLGTPEAQLARAAFGWGRGSVHTNVVVGGPLVPGLRTLASLERPWLAEPQPADVAPDDPAVIAFTTGSTGDPKPTVMTHRNVASMIRAVGTRWGLIDRDGVVDMPTFPGFWIIGLSFGGTVVVPPMNFATKGPGDADPAKLARTIAEFGVESMFASPALLTNLARYCEENDLKLSSVRRIVAGGAEINGPLFRAVKNIVVNGEMYSDYGATEALPVSEIDGTMVLDETWPLTETGAGLCAGHPLPGVEVRIIEIEDGPIDTIEHARILPTGVIGEVLARGPHVSDRYWQAPGDMRDNKITDGDTRWHRLGDTGFLDDQGRLWVCGRCSHRVVTPAATYYPLCCEPVFNTHPDVARSALVDPSRPAAGTPTVCVELHHDARGREAQVRHDLVELADAHEATKGIDSFVFLDRLPVDRRHNAKIDRPALAAGVG